MLLSGAVRSWALPFTVGCIIGGLVSCCVISWRLNSGPGSLALVDARSIMVSIPRRGLSVSEWVLANRALDNAWWYRGHYFLIPGSGDSSATYGIIKMRSALAPFGVNREDEAIDDAIEDLLTTIANTGSTNGWVEKWRVD